MKLLIPHVRSIYFFYQKISLNSWFWPHLKKDLDYYSIEVYGEKPEELLKQKELTQNMIYNSVIKDKKLNGR